MTGVRLGLAATVGRAIPLGVTERFQRPDGKMQSRRHMATWQDKISPPRERVFSVPLSPGSNVHGT